MDKETKIPNIPTSQSEPVPKEQNVPAGEINITVIQAAIDDRFKKNEEDIKNINNLMLVGFFVLQLINFIGISSIF